MILFHGLGDTNLPFSKLGKQLRLPQTATLSLRAPEKVPYLDEEAYQWYESFDAFGEFLTKPNPTRVLDLLEQFLDHLVRDCQWSPNKIHLFGFGQGGSVAVELGLRWWRSRCGGGRSPDIRLGSIVSVAGPLLSHPTLTSRCITPTIVFYRQVSDSTKLTASDIASLRKGYENIQEVKGAPGEGMPRSKEEWEDIMKFWNSFLSRRTGSGLYEVLAGSA